ncbi:hypothetical protein PVAP13_3KG059600 [Panicum virgatum]|uniref:Protein FLX-like 3 n=1 Tax=Panicum virgatum TaxID=38727 RepID=A0A8T0UM69_PANVG|nr:hypothetical protein PVAP13_3KG059600 [Panicum virgatum]
MSERGRLPRRPIDDRRGYNEVRLVEPRGYPEAHVVDGRVGYLDTRLVDERRSYSGVRMIDDRRGYSAIRIDDRRAYPDTHEGPRMRAAPHPHPAFLEEELESQELELRRLLADNRALAEERADLNRELQAGKDELRHLNVIISDITAEKESYISKLVDKKRKLEAELRENEHLRDEIVQLRGEIEKLVAARKELSAEAASLMEDLTRERSVKHQLPMLKAELDGLQQELFHVRTACELERKGNFELVEQRKGMEKNMISMAQEIEQMRAELAKSEVRPWGTGTTMGLIYFTVLQILLSLLHIPLLIVRKSYCCNSLRSVYLTEFLCIFSYFFQPLTLLC